MYPVFLPKGIPGGLDWDEALFFHGANRLSLLEYHQIPFWNPYACGGTWLWGNPISASISIFEIFVLLFGIPLGLKIKMTVLLAFGMIGMYILSKQLGMSRFAAFFPPVIFMLSSYWSTIFTAGTLSFLSLAYIPWVFFFYLKGRENKKFFLISAVFLTLLFFENPSYIFPYTILLLSIIAVIHVIKTKRLSEIKSLIILLIVTILLSSIVLLPRIEIFLNNPRTIEGDSPADGTDLKYIDDVFLNKHHASDDWQWNWRIDQKLEAWYAYTFYVGIIPLILFALGMIFLFTSYIELTLSALVFLWLMMGPKIPISLWNILHKFPIFSSQHMPNRFVIVFAFLMALIVGLFVSKLEKSKLKLNKFIISRKISKLIVLILLIIVTLNMLFTNSKAFSSFPILPEGIKFEDKEFAQVSNYHNFNWNINVYKNMLENKGTIQCGVTPSFPRSKAENSVIPKYFIIEQNSIPANYNHLPILYYDNKNINQAWWIQDEINELVQNKWKLNNKLVNVNLLFFDANNQIPEVIPQNSQTKMVLPSRNLVKIDFTYTKDNKQIKNELVLRENKTSAGNLSLAGKIREQDGQTLITTNLFVILIEEDLKINKEYNVSLTIFEDNNPIDKIFNPDYRGEVYLLNNKGTAELTYFSPNKLIVNINANEPDTLIINQNYFKGWHVKNSDKKIYEHKGLPGVDIDPGSYELTLYYRMPGFYLGALLTLIGIIITILLIKKYK